MPPGWVCVLPPLLLNIALNLCFYTVFVAWSTLSCGSGFTCNATTNEYLSNVVLFLNFGMAAVGGYLADVTGLGKLRVIVWASGAAFVSLLVMVVCAAVDAQSQASSALVMLFGLVYVLANGTAVACLSAFLDVVTDTVNPLLYWIGVQLASAAAIGLYGATSTITLVYAADGGKAEHPVKFVGGLTTALGVTLVCMLAATAKGWYRRDAVHAPRHGADGGSNDKHLPLLADAPQDGARAAGDGGSNDKHLPLLADAPQDGARAAGNAAGGMQAMAGLALRLAPVVVFYGVFFQIFSSFSDTASRTDLKLGPHTKATGKTLAAATPVMEIVIILAASGYRAVVPAEPVVSEAQEQADAGRWMVRGLLLAAASVVCALGVEVAAFHYDPNSLSVWTTLPAYVLVSAAEVAFTPSALRFASFAHLSSAALLEGALFLSIALGALLLCLITWLTSLSDGDHNAVWEYAAFIVIVLLVAGTLNRMV